MNTKMKFYGITAVTLLVLLGSSPLIGADGNVTDSFAKTYAGLEIGRNFPTSSSEENFSPGKAHPVLAYRYVLDDKWLMGISGGFRMLQFTGDADQREKELPILSIVHESARILRLYHPTYLSTGFRFMYMMPATHAMVPTGKSKDFSTEFGASITATLIHLVDQKKMITFRLERWRGTGTSQYHGIEIALGGALSFD